MRGLVGGADLAPLVERHDIDLAAPALDGTWTVLFPRPASDGTLLDALRAALAIGHGPEDLLALTAEPEEEWEEDLAAIDHPGLRAHLGHGQLDIRVARLTDDVAGPCHGPHRSPSC